MKILKIRINDEVLTKIQNAMDKIEDSRQKESVELSFSELRFLKRLILSDLATMELMFESLDEHREFVKKQKRGE